LESALCVKTRSRSYTYPVVAAARNNFAYGASRKREPVILSDAKNLSYSGGSIGAYSRATNGYETPITKSEIAMVAEKNRIGAFTGP
jgi:hypothetical protein